MAEAKKRAPRTTVKMVKDTEEPVVEEKKAEEPVERPSTGHTSTAPSAEIEFTEEDYDDDLEEEEEITVEELEPDEEVWPGGPTASQIIEWKEIYGDVYLTAITPDYNVLWRTISRPEYVSHVKLLEDLTNSGQLSAVETNLYNEEAISELCIIYPEFSRDNMEDTLAGVPALISEQVMQASGFQALTVRQL